MISKAVAIVGFKDSGKTQVVEALTRELIQRGFKVATIKHTAEDVALDTPGKDTERHRQAGALSTAILHSGGAAIFYQYPQTIQKVAEKLGNPDYIILEGFKKINYIPQVLVPRVNTEIPELTNGLEIAVAQLGNRQLSHITPVIDIKNSEQLANIVQKNAIPLLSGKNCKTCGYQNCSEMARALLDGTSKIEQCIGYHKNGVILKVDGKVVPMNKFTAGITQNIIRGILKSLKDVNPNGKIELKIDE